MKRWLSVIACLLLLTLLIPAPVGADDLPFAVYHGSRDEKRIAVTVCDCYDIRVVGEMFDLSQRLGVDLTFFPYAYILHQEDAELWRAIAASSCEIGSFTFESKKLTTLTARQIIASLARMQEALDAVLGYHYEMNCMRPPFGTVLDENGSNKKVAQAVRAYGFDHAILWDVSQTDPKRALKDVRNGSILLYHAKPQDLACLEVLLPDLIAEGYELVTVSELLGFGEIATSTDLFTFAWDDNPFFH